MSHLDEIPEDGARKSRAFISIAVVVIFLVVTAYYILQHPDEFRRLRELPPQWLVLSCAGILASLIANGLFIKLTMQGFEIEMPFREWFALSLAVSGLNYVSPFRGGAALRGVYLRSRYGFSWIDFVTTLAGATAVALFVHSVLGIAAVLTLGLRGAPLDVPLLLFFGALAAILAATLFAGNALSTPKSGLLRPFVRLANGWQQLRRRQKLLPLLLANGIFFFAANGVAFAAAFRALEIELDIMEVTFYVAATGIASLVALTPGALGIQEAFSLYMARVLPYAVSDALMAQLIIRALALSVLAISFPFAMRTLGMNSRDAVRGQKRAHRG